jgi:hypothetical protein
MSRARQVSQLIGASNTHLVSTPATFSNTVAVAASGITYGDASVQTTAPSGFGFKNRIINGDMRIDQRNAGASVACPAGTVQAFITDRFWAQRYAGTTAFSAQQSTTAPAGFVNSLLFTTTTSGSSGSTDTTFFAQRIEGLNTADLGWGTASAQAVTISFWVRSSLTGSFSGAVNNSGASRSYPFSFSINAANTWEQKTITVAGDTSGTWLTTNGTGVQLTFDLGCGSTYRGTANAWAGASYFGVTSAVSLVGTGSATFYITGVQLEKGSTATAFDYRPYGYEVQLCQRYLEKSFPINVAPYNPGEGQINGYSIGMATNRSGTGTTIQYAVRKRVNPTVTNYGNSSGYWSYQSPNGTITSSVNVGPAGGTENGFMFTQQAVDGAAIFIMGHWVASAEL